MSAAEPKKEPSRAVKATRRMVEVTRGPGGLATLGLEMVLGLVLALLGGMWLDKKLGTDPIFLWVGFAFGLATAVRAVQRAMKTMRAIAAREEREHGNPEPVYETDEERAARAMERKKQAEVKVDGDGGPTEEPAK